MLRRAIPVEKYLANLEGEKKRKYDQRRETYTVKTEVLDALKAQADRFIVIAISAIWCKDCATHIPVLDLIRAATGLQIKVLSGAKTDPLNPNRQWAVPPSPPEVESLCITRIPTILVFSKDGLEIGRITEHPEITPTLEEELLHIMMKETN
jgi:hypothetical protein